MRRSGWVGRSAASAAGIMLDALIGEPPVKPHPVAVFGTVMTRAEQRWWADDRGAGARHAALGVGLGAGAGFVLHSTAAATYLSVAGRSLAETALSIAAVVDSGDIGASRRAVGALVGRNTDELDEVAILRAIIESVAENTVDAVVAPALWAAALGAPGTLGYRAINTLDAMVGHHNPRYENFGFVSARLDDVANLVPARVTAGLVVACRPSQAAAVWRAVRDQAPAHPSPNSGVAEAAFAAALGIGLGGPLVYGDRREDRPVLGDGSDPIVADVHRAVALSRQVALTLAAALALPVCLRGCQRCARRPRS